MSKVKDSTQLLRIKLPLELLAKIASYRDGWCGATEQDCYGVLRLWETTTHKLQFGQ